MASEFEKAWYRNCPTHRKVRFLFFKKCWKCEILEHAHNFHDIRLMLIAKKLK
jgi:hypothetical protein